VRAGTSAIQQIISLWQALPPGESARCHVPPFGVRFFSGETVMCQASICWRCNNIYGEAGGQQFYYFFDAKAPSSRSLLSLFEALLGTPAVE
jgi:hypothetical protein